MASPLDFPDSDFENLKYRQIIHPNLQDNKQKQTKEFENFAEGIGTKKICLCDAVKDLYIICQLCAILPLTHDRKTCRFVHSWFSFLSCINLAWILGFVVLVVVLSPKALEMFSKRFHGTNLYTFVITLIVQFISTFLIYAFGNYNASRLGKAWDKVHKVSAELIGPNLKKLRYVMYLPSVYLMTELGMGMAVIFYVASVEDENTSSLHVGLPISNFFTVCVPEVVAGTFSAVLWIIGLNFDAVNKTLEKIVKEDSSSLAPKLAELRGQHEELCAAVRILQDAFGVPILAVFVGTSVAFVSGLYATLVMAQEFDKFVNVNPYHLLHGAGTIVFNAIRLTIIVLTSQRVTNSANRPASILNKFDETGHSGEVKLEVEAFLSKVGDFPLRIRCCNIFDLGAAFLASGVSNVVTYTLILLQFGQSNG